MATPTLTLIGHTSINTAESTTDWDQWDLLDSELKKEGSNAITGTFRTDQQEGYYDAGGAPVTAVGKHFRAWFNFTGYAFLDTEANGGMEFFMYDGSSSEYKVAFSSDDYFGGWKNFVINCDLFTTLTLANVDRWGCRFNRTAAPKNVDNFWTDYFRYLDGYSFTGGSDSDPVTLADIAAEDIETGGTLNGYGIILEYEGVYIGYGELQVGSGATSTYFLMDGEVLAFSDQQVAAGLYTISGDGSGCNIEITDSTVRSAGTGDNTRFVLDLSDTNINSCVITSSVFYRGGAITFASGWTVTGNTFNDCGQITHAGADMDDCVIKNYEGTANTSALIYNVNADPDGEMDDMKFEKGTAATHAIEFGTSSPTTMTLRGITFTDYNASDSQNDSTFHFKRTGGSVTLNLVDCTGNFSYRTDGATITISVSPRTLTLTGVQQDSEITIVEKDDPSVVLHHIESSATDGEDDYVYTYAAPGLAATVMVFHLDYEPYYQDVTLADTDWELPISQVEDRVYSNP